MTVWHCVVRCAKQRTQQQEMVIKISVIATNMEGKVPRISLRGRESDGGGGLIMKLLLLGLV